MGVRLRRRLEGDARSARRQGRQRRRDDPRAGVEERCPRASRSRPRRASSTCAPAQVPDGLAEQVAEALGRLAGPAGKRFGDDEDPLLVSVRSGARESMPGMLDTILNLGLNDQAVPGWRTRPTTSGSPGTPTGVWCRCSATSPPASRLGALRGRARRRSRAPTASTATPSCSVDALRELVERVPGALRVPPGSPRAAAAGDPRGVRLVDGRPGGQVPAHQPDPRRLGHGGQRAADGVRQQGRELGDGRRVQSRRGDRGAGALRRLPGQRSGGGRRLWCAHTPRSRRAGRGDA